MKKIGVIAVACLLTTDSVLASEGVDWGAYVDTYYAWDFQAPPSKDRAFTTQAVRHNEFNVNMAFLEAKLNQERVRGRLALQMGTAVQANYAGEPTIGTFSGPSLVRHIQEGYGGVRIAPDLWIDAGIFFSHVGLEGWISADNWTYTRSLVADYSPYYQAGVRAGWKASEALSFQLLVLNGWQIISENNDAKTLGTQIAYAPNSVWSLSFSTLLGNENGFRQFHDWVLKVTPSDFYQAAFEFDVGSQSRSGASNAIWNGFTFIQRFKLYEELHLAARVERYWDPNGVIAVTPDGIPLRAWGASLGLDYAVTPKALIRTEFRSIWAKDAVFPSNSGNQDTNSVWTTSLALRL